MLLDASRNEAFVHLAGLKDRPGSALFKLLFSHFGQRLPHRSHPIVRLFLLSFGSLRRPPSPCPPRDLDTQSPSAWKHSIPQTQLNAILQANLRRVHDGLPSRSAKAQEDGGLSMLAGNYLWSRWLRGTAIIPAKEFLFNLHRDLVQPLLGPIRSILMTSDLHFKLSYPIFSHSKLTGEFATRLHGLLITGLGSIGGLADHLQDQVARLLKRIASFGLLLGLGAKGTTASVMAALRLLMALTPTRGRLGRRQISPPIYPRVDPLWITRLAAATFGSLGRRSSPPPLSDANSDPFNESV
jgi:hypothetical protein